MSDIESADWTEAAAGNSATPPNGWPEGMAPSSVNDAARETHAAIKREWNRSHTTITSTGTSTAYVLTYTTAPAAYVHGQRFAFKVDEDCGASATANVNSLGAKTIKKMTSAGLVNLAAGDLQADHHAILEYDSGLDVMVLLSPTLVATFPAGTSILFRQAAAPTGWTKDTVNNDAALRIVSGTPTTGGVTGFSSVFGASKTTGDTALTIAQMPLHGHPVRRNTGTGSGNEGHGTGGILVNDTPAANDAAYTGTPSDVAGRQIGGTGGVGVRDRLRRNSVYVRATAPLHVRDLRRHHAALTLVEVPTMPRRAWVTRARATSPRARAAGGGLVGG